MKNILLLNKKEGETPLETLENFRRKHKEYEGVPMTYAGRLDPMASGLLLILTGEETKNKDKYLSFDKEYEFEILFGFATDTYDILGKVTNRARGVLTQKEIEKEIQKNLKHFTGKFTQKYPPYSSKTVKGKPMFAYARADETVEVPEREVFVKSLKFEKTRKISSKILLQNIEKRIMKVKGDFRQKEIIEIWKKELSHQKYIGGFLVASFKIKCGSGTYVRGIANSLGEKIGISALAFYIKRTKIGKWSKI